jgi:hypothetical protein
MRDMSVRRAALLLMTVWMASTGCRRVSERTLTDTEGRTFHAECDREGRCKLTRKSAKPVSEDMSDVALHSPGLLIAICDVPPEQDPSASADCRPLVCKEDDDCPPSHGIKDGSCSNGLCIEPSHDLAVDDAVMLCLAGTGLGRSGPNQVDRYAMALNCGTPCRVPAPCRQP